MRFLITGGAGFIGSALANRLVGAGHDVRVLDDLSAGCDPARLDPRVLFTRGDVRNVPKLWTLLQKVDCVYHLAARVYVEQSVLYPREYNDVNVGGTVAVMEAMRDAGVKRVVLASSGAVYGEQAMQPVKETQPPNPQSPYAVSKIAAEHYVFTIGALWDIETVALRIFNAYGPGQQLPTSHPPVIPQSVKQALSGGSLVVFGDGSQTRDFVHIDDVVEAMVAAATASDVDRAIINVGSGRELSINELIKKVEQATRRKVHSLYNAAQSGGVSRLVADISLAKRKLGFKPRTDIDKGLRLLLERDPQFKVAAKV
ncbi:MAG: NAD-dependent epimerase/dehydratase family protein [Anaerolineales bacterium]|nr:MAG: NAD-dependent epimerase/dehydratase family protein [Anaerolineales bacterium]